MSASLSENGNAAIVGAPADHSAGAGFPFERIKGVWYSAPGGALVGAGAVGDAKQGQSVAISADGSTAIIGGPADNSGIGAAWVFVSGTNGQWTAQGGKMVGSGSVGASGQGTSVAISSDGNTVLIGGPGDNGQTGAVWVFTRSNGVWTQQGGKLVGSGGVSLTGQGNSVALSADGNTALVGGPLDSLGAGAAWVFTQSGGTWTQSGGKLVGSPRAGVGEQGWSVALSSDGATAIVGSPGDNYGASQSGAAFVYALANGVWTQQAKFVESNGAGVQGGYSVSISADGNTAVMSGFNGSGNGGAWVFSRIGSNWAQQDGEVIGSNATGGSDQGTSVSLSADGTTLMIGAPNGNDDAGTVWVFTPKSSAVASHDFNGDTDSDILWRDPAGDLAMWLMSGGQLAAGALLPTADTSWSVVGTRDFNGDGDADILWLDQSSDLAIWLMNGTTFGSAISLGQVGTQWQVAGTGDFNNDKTGDILWRNSSTGDVAIWLMSNGQLASGFDLGAVSLTWQIVGTGDFNGDGTTDILWRNTSTGDLAIWFLDNGQFSSGTDLGQVSLNWTVVGTGKFDGKSSSDILWRDTSGNLAIWLMNNGQLSSGAILGQVPLTWSVAETGDFNGDGKSDILWTDQSGDVAIWLMNGLSVSSYETIGNVGTSWQVQGQNAD